MATTAAAKYMTMDEVAAMLHVGKQTIGRWVREGRLCKPKAIGRRLLFDAQEIEARLNRRSSHGFPERYRR